MKDTPISHPGQGVDQQQHAATEPESPAVQEQAAQSSDRPRVHAPRSLWWELVLVVATVSVYYSFWMVSRARDVKNLKDEGYTPWLWFFVPSLFIVQPFAFHQMFKDLDSLEENQQQKLWLNQGVVWIAIVTIASLFSTVSEFLELPFYWWTFLLVILVICVAFSLLHIRFNNLKTNYAKELDFFPKKTIFYWWEWTLLVVAAVLWGSFLVDTFTEPDSVVRKLPQSYLHVDKEAGYQLQIDGEDWRQVEIGSYSDGTAEVEFSHSGLSGYLLVFKHGIGDSVNSIASFRFLEIQSEYNASKDCKENRRLSPDGKSVISSTVCLKESKTKGVVGVSSLVKVNGVYYELLGYGNDSNSIFKKLKPTILAAGESFAAIETAAAQTEASK